MFETENPLEKQQHLNEWNGTRMWIGENIKNEDKIYIEWDQMEWASSLWPWINLMHDYLIQNQSRWNEDRRRPLQFQSGGKQKQEE